MFTGIIEETGTLLRLDTAAGGARVEIRAGAVLGGTRIGDSIAVDGVCLTVEKVTGSLFTAFLSSETMARTTFARARSGDPVNLERALAMGDRLGGHLVSGHVEATGTVREMRETGEGRLLVVSCPHGFMPYAVQKGSVSVHGVSLTIAGVEGDRFSVAVIPETFEKTTFRLKRPGDFVNLEPDLILKYVMSAVRNLSDGDGDRLVTLARLREAGFLAD
ncbi:MAG: riboflavin synthase [bacterium]|nr:riboflavin synthase [bacterium]MDT8395471.1 riboflavin synthase [bacterium]